jgi:hypothetical protein
MGLASAASSSCKSSSSSCISILVAGTASSDFFAFEAGAAVVRVTETLFEFAVVRLTAVDDFGTGTAFLFSEERDSESGLKAASSVSSHIL